MAVEFDLDTDTEEAEADMQDTIAALQLPQQAGEPEVQRQSAAEFPILNISLAARDEDLASLTTYTQDEAIPRLEEVEGVERVELVGGAEERIEVDLDPEELRENNLPPEPVAGAINGANVNAPVGAVQADELSSPVRVTGESTEDAEALEVLPVGAGAAAAAGPPGRGGLGGSRESGSPGGAASGGYSRRWSSWRRCSGSGNLFDSGYSGGRSGVREAGSDIAGISRTNGEPSLGLNITTA